MVKDKENITSGELLSHIIEGIRKVKGKDIVNIDLGALENRVTEFFVICHGDSNTQVNAIADSVYREVKEQSGGSCLHREGMDNAQWVLMDYGAVVVHVFQKEFRDFYRLEELWADGKVTRLE